MTAINLSPAEMALIYSALGAYSDDEETRALSRRFFVPATRPAPSHHVELIGDAQDPEHNLIATCETCDWHFTHYDLDEVKKAVAEHAA